MKKLILPVLIAAGLFGASCRKQRTCECKTTRTEVRTGFGAQTTIDNSSDKVTKDKQRKKPFKYYENCFSESYSYPDSGGNGPSAWSSVVTVQTDCELK